MEFNYAFKEENVNRSPEYVVPFGAPLPPLQVSNNARYRKTIDLIQFMWNKFSPEIDFVPFKDKHIFNPEKGYIVYSLVRCRPVDNMPKMKHHETLNHADDPDKKTVVFIQSFYYFVKFTAVHQEPIVAEEIIESFEDFMLFATPQLLRMGVEQVLYGERPADETKTRYGEDLAARATMYEFKIQKIAAQDLEKLKTIYGQVQVFSESQFNTYGLPRQLEGINIFAKDYYQGATPST